MNILIRRFYQIKMSLILACCMAFSFLSRQKPWVLFERGTDARDNAYFFYLYLKKNYPDRKIYYIIDKNSPDYYKVKEHAVFFGSFKNYWAIATAEKLISTHCNRSLPFINPKIFRFFKLNRKYYFLQHGVMKDDVPGLHYDQTGVRLFVCGAKPEYDFIDGRFGYPTGAVQYTGLARYDNLHDVRTKRQILIMPTWRKYVCDDKVDFLKTEYYCQWNQLLNDPKFVDYLDNNDLTAVFYPHYEVQKYLSLFSSGSKRIILADFAHFDVQTLLKESKLLITDFSSVFFDFGYMRKPVVYFQFDRDDFFSKHYEPGYFSYTDMGFGPVVDNVAAVVRSVEQITDNDFVPSEDYLKRIDDFFPLYDQKNCERIYDAICSL